MYSNNCIEKNQNKTHFEEGTSESLYYLTTIPPHLYATISFIKKIAIQFSENEGVGGQRLFGIFPKIHLIWQPDPSLNLGSIKNLQMLANMPYKKTGCSRPCRNVGQKSNVMICPKLLLTIAFPQITCYDFVLCLQTIGCWQHSLQVSQSWATSSHCVSC